jgi:hypothetical protein
MPAAIGFADAWVAEVLWVPSLVGLVRAISDRLRSERRSGTGQGGRSAAQTEIIPRVRGRVSAPLPRGWFAKESLTLLAHDRQANVIVSSEPLDPGVDAARYAEQSGEVLQREFRGYRELAFRPTLLLGGRQGYCREFEWSPADGKPVRQIQLHYTEGGRGYTATASAQSDAFTRYEAVLRWVLEGLSLERGVEEDAGAGVLRPEPTPPAADPHRATGAPSSGPAGAEPGSATSPAEEHVAAAAARIETEPSTALRGLKEAFRVDPGHAPAYRVAAECLRRLGGAQEAKLFERVLDRFDESEPFHRLGYHFVEADREDWAVPFLERALALAPGDARAAAELAVALAATFRPQDGRKVLAGIDQVGRFRGEFGLVHQYAWCSLLCNRPEGIRGFIESSRSALPGAAPLPRRRVRAYLSMLDRLDECLTRLESLPDPELHVRAWHYIQYGAAILDYFEDTTVAGGRYVALWGSYAQVATILRRLQTFLTELDRYPKLVAGLPDRDSEIVGRAAAQILGLSLEPATQELLGRPDVLVVAANNRALGEHPLLREVQSGQTVFCASLNWTARASVTPDVAGLMSQYYELPWNGQLRLDPNSGKPERTPADDRPAAAIARDLAETPPEEDPAFSEVLAFYAKRAAYLKAGSPGTRRLRFRKDSPVPASAFG